MHVVSTSISGVKKIILHPFIDNRGFWMRTFDENLFNQNHIPINWVQENHSKSLKKNTIRGLHFLMSPHSDAKLIRCIKGSILDVIVDLRLNSDTFGKVETFELRDSIFEMIYIPKGFAHGFCTLEDNCEMIYKHDSFYLKDYDSGIRWDDIEIGINWPIKEPIVSEKDSNLMTFSEFKKQVGGLFYK